MKIIAISFLFTETKRKRSKAFQYVANAKTKKITARVLFQVMFSG